MEIGLLLLRLAVGSVIAAHGAQKLFGWFGGYGVSGTGGWLESLGFRPGRPYAVLNGMAEFGGGLLIALGLLTPLGAAAVVGVMLVAVGTVHWPNGFFNTKGGYEFNLLLAASALALAFTGPGAFSIDRALGLSVRGLEWGLVALLVGLITGAAALESRRPEIRYTEVEAEAEKEHGRAA